MSTSFPSPSRVSGDDWNEIAKEIVVLTTILKNHRSEGITHSMPKDPELQLFQHLSVLVTTGELGRKITDRNASTANATSGRIEADRIVLVLVTPNALPESEDSGGTWNIVKPTANDLRGGQLLLGWKYSKADTRFDSHLQDVVDIIHHVTLSANNDHTNTPKDRKQLLGRMLLFIHRRALPKLAARVENTVLLWAEAPFHTVARYYIEQAQSGSPVHVTSASFSLTCPAHKHDKLERAGLGKDSSGVYHVTSANIGMWAAFIDSTFSDIQGVVLREGKPRLTALNPEETMDLVDAIGMFKMLIEEKELMSVIFEPPALENRLHSQYTNGMHAFPARKKSPSPDDGKTNTPDNEHAVADGASSMSKTGELFDGDDDWLMDDDPSDEPNAFNLIGRSAHVVRFCRTITAWYEAVQVIVKSVQRYPKLLEIYHVKALPRRHDLSESDVASFKNRCLAHFQTKTPPEIRDNALLFLQHRLGSERAVEAVVNTAQTAMVHAEATVMGLASISQLDGNFVGIDKTVVETLFSPASTKITIAVSKKCCRSCIILAEIMSEYLNVTFVLPGTHATFFPWSPPQGVPLDALKKMRDRLDAVFQEVACSFSLAPSTKTSPASSTIDLEDEYDREAVKNDPEYPDGETELHPSKPEN